MLLFFPDTIEFFGLLISRKHLFKSVEVICKDGVLVFSSEALEMELLEQHIEGDTFLVSELVHTWKGVLRGVHMGYV